MGLVPAVGESMDDRKRTIVFFAIRSSFMKKPDHSKKNQEKIETKKGVYDLLNRWFKTHTTPWIVGVLIVAMLAGLLTFDVKPSTGGDDTAYILQAMDIASTGHIPIGFRTPGYPIVLAFFVLLLGVNIVLLKMTSLLCFLGVVISLFFVFRNRLQPMVLYPLLLLAAINPLLLEYAHQTYSELLFAFILVWTIHLILTANETDSILLTIFAALLTMVSFYIRIAGVTIMGAAILFFLLQRRWKQLGIFIVVCILLYSPLKIYEWISGTAAFGGASGYFLKNYYDATLGTETVGGFIGRFVNNVINHLNYQFPSAIGLPMPIEISGADGRIIPESSAFLGILVSVVLLIGCIAPIIVRPKSAYSFLGIFVIAYVSFICLALQNQISTIRMLVPVIPYLLIATLEGFRWLGNRWDKVIDADAVTVRAKRLMLAALFGLMLAGAAGTRRAVADNYPVLKANLGGNEFAGFTEDWVNYLRASVWIKEHLPAETTRVICRKPELFMLYTGNYYADGVYQIDRTNPDSIVGKWKRLRMTHLLYDEFQWSSTLRRYVQPVAQKYPQMFDLVHQEGRQFPSYVFRLNYAAVDSARDH